MKKIMLLLITSYLLFGANYQKNCLECHRNIPITLHAIYMDYLLRFSTNKQIAEAMFYFLKDPKIEQAILEETKVKRFGIMPKLSVSDQELRALIETLIERNDLRFKLH